MKEKTMWDNIKIEITSFGSDFIEILQGNNQITE